MFGLFKNKKNKLEQLIDEHGLEQTALGFAAAYAEQINSRELGYEFVLQELDAASGGNDFSKRFAESSGIPSSEYKGSMKKQIDAIDEPQDHLNSLCFSLIKNRQLMVEFRTEVTRGIMKIFKLGCYDPWLEDEQESGGAIANEDDDTELYYAFGMSSSKSDSIFVEAMNDLGAYIELNDNHCSSQTKMAYAYARRVVAAGLYLQGLVTREMYEHSLMIFKALQQQTGHTTEFQEAAYDEALELLELYDHDLTRQVSARLVRYAESIEVEYNPDSPALSDREVIEQFGSA